VNTGETVTLVPLPGDFRLKNNLDLFINGSLNAEIHTSCSVPIAIGFVYGDFTITYGESRNNGAFCDATGLRLRKEPMDPLHSATISTSTYPNPFWNEITIAFTLPESADTRVEVVNIQGDVLMVRDLGMLDQGVDHSVLFDSKDNLPNGTYIYRIISGSHLATGKLIRMH
jgi:hypothetical protein